MLLATTLTVDRALKGGTFAFAVTQGPSELHSVEKIKWAVEDATQGVRESRTAEGSVSVELRKMYSGPGW
ncbi:hypothetical protein PM082_009705 [Marasmius tenuissimus]|nr:hypothetical protein PM082_009705 [Marasmius tenuissimus]